jgi:NTE family protein
MSAPLRTDPLTGTALLGGGARAAYQVGVLAWLSEHLPELPMPLVAGVSAGAANAMAVASLGSLGETVEKLRAGWRTLNDEEIFDTFPSGRSYSLFGCLREYVRRTGGAGTAFAGLFDDRPIRKFVSSCTSFAGLEANVSSGRLHAVALTASSYDSGKSVTFFQGRPSLENWTRSHGSGVATQLRTTHIMASGAIPILFPPVRIGDGLFGDGNVRQQFPLSPLIRLGADRILVVDPGPASQSVRSRGGARGTIPETFGLLLDSMVVDRIESDVARLEEINELLACGYRSRKGAARRRIDFLLIRPKVDVGGIAAALGPPRSRTLRLFSRLAGGWDDRVAGLLSYLWVDRRFTDRLFELGYADARDRRLELEDFLRPPALTHTPPTRIAG